MPLLKQPRSLLKQCVIATSDILLSHTIFNHGIEQEETLKRMLLLNIPPVIVQEVLNFTIKHFAVSHCKNASVFNLSCLLRILLHPKLTEVRLSDLTYIGSVTSEDLDILENALVSLFPNMNQLTYLDLSTHHDKLTWPSCSFKILKVLGKYCPNLKVLDLMNNNRVDGEGLLCLYPNDYQEGCTKLENLYVQECSVEPEDIAMFLLHFPNLKLVGYKELGTSLKMLKKQPRRFGGRKKHFQLKLNLTHMDNTKSRYHRGHGDGDIIHFLWEVCPDVENLKVRISEKDLKNIEYLKNLRHLELRFYTGIHHPVGSGLNLLLKQMGHRLLSLTIFCNQLTGTNVIDIAKYCLNLTKLFLYANRAAVDLNLENMHLENNLQNLEVLSLRIGYDELILCPAACSVVKFLVRPCTILQELYLLMRSTGITNEFLASLLEINPLIHLKIFMCDAPRRTLVAPMHELTLESAFFLIQRLQSLQVLGNLICWNVTKAETANVFDQIGAL